MRYLLGGPPAYAAATGGANLRCPHLKLMVKQPAAAAAAGADDDLHRSSTGGTEEGGGGGASTAKAAGGGRDVLDGTKFDRLVGMLNGILTELGLPQVGGWGRWVAGGGEQVRCAARCGRKMVWKGCVQKAPTFLQRASRCHCCLIHARSCRSVWRLHHSRANTATARNIPPYCIGFG